MLSLIFFFVSFFFQLKIRAFNDSFLHKDQINQYKFSTPIEKTRMLQTTQSILLITRNYTGLDELNIGMAYLPVYNLYMLTIEDEDTSITQGYVYYNIYNSNLSLVNQGVVKGTFLNSYLTSTSVAGVGGVFQIWWISNDVLFYEQVNATFDTSIFGNFIVVTQNQIMAYVTTSNDGFLITDVYIAGSNFEIIEYFYDINGNYIKKESQVFFQCNSLNYIMNYQGIEISSSNVVNIYEYMAKITMIFPNVSNYVNKSIAAGYTYVCNPDLIYLNNNSFVIIYQYQMTLNSGYLIGGEVYNYVNSSFVELISTFLFTHHHTIMCHLSISHQFRHIIVVLIQLLVLLSCNI